MHTQCVANIFNFSVLQGMLLGMAPASEPDASVDKDSRAAARRILKQAPALKTRSIAVSVAFSQLSQVLVTQCLPCFTALLLRLHASIVLVVNLSCFPCVCRSWPQT